MMMIVSSVAMLCLITLSLLLTINISAAASIHHPDQLQVYFHELLGAGAGSDYQQLEHPAVLLPRKLMVNKKGEEDYEEAYKGRLVSSNQQNKPAYSGRREELVKVRVHAKAGTREEWIEGSDESHEFFTMDYSHVRRRRPIHNKSLIPMSTLSTTSHP